MIDYLRQIRSEISDIGHIIVQVDAIVANAGQGGSTLDMDLVRAHAELRRATGALRSLHSLMSRLISDVAASWPLRSLPARRHRR